jgi:hypothetical protein
MTNPLPLTVRAIIAHFPAVVPHLSRQARIAFSIDDAKTYDYFLKQVERLVRSLYRGDIGSDFVFTMTNLISGQLRQAFTQAWTDEDGRGDLPPYLTDALESMMAGQLEHIDAFYRAIIDAKVDGTPIDPLLARAALWANQYNSAYNEAARLIVLEGGGNLVWRYGDAEHCPECAALNGIVARASEWDSLGVKPQSPPNPLISCGGWRCRCSLTPTDQRRSPKAYNIIMNIVGK